MSLIFYKPNSNLFDIWKYNEFNIAGVLAQPKELGSVGLKFAVRAPPEQTVTAQSA